VRIASSRERTPWHATQRAAWGALRRPRVARSNPEKKADHATPAEICSRSIDYKSRSALSLFCWESHFICSSALPTGYGCLLRCHSG
jgi:hypothetical protein